MTSADTIRNNIIDKLLTISNLEYLDALNKLIEKSSAGDDVIKLSDAQLAMLNLSEADIRNGKLIDQQELDKQDFEWLKNL